nr:hypothetical protein [Tanacetum cinerariifolium]
FKECSSCGALYNKSCGCSKGGFVDKFVRDPNKTPDSFQRPPHDCLKCGNPVDGLHCRQCALLQKKLKEDPVENSSQTPPHIDHHCCYGCGDSLDGIFCQRCTYENPFAYDSTPNFVNDSPNVFNPPPQPPTNSYEFFGNDAYYSYDCPPQVMFIYNLEPYYNQDTHKIFKVSNNNILVVKAVGARMRPFNFLVIYQPPQETSVEILHDHENVINYVQTFLRKLNHFSFLKTLKVLFLAWDRVFEIKNASGNKKYKPEDIQELFHKLFNDVKNIHEELAEYINTPSWNRPAFYNYGDDDDEDNTIAITPEEPDNSLSMGDKHLDTISATESDEVIKSSVEDLVPIPSESKGIPDNMCDVPFRDNSSPLDIQTINLRLSRIHDDSTSIDDNSFSIDDIDYVEASPPDSELFSLDREIKDDILREKLLKIHIFIDKIESLNDNPTLDRVLKSSSSFPIPVEDSDSLFENSDTSLSYSDNYLLEFEIFSYHTEETSNGSTTTHANYSLPKYDSFIFKIELDQEEKNSGSTTIYVDISLSDFDHFYFKIEPDPGELTSIVDFEIRKNVPSTTNVNLSPKDDQSPLFAYVLWIFLSFLMYLVVPPYLLSSENEVTIFNPGISIYHPLCWVYLIGVELS